MTLLSRRVVLLLVTAATAVVTVSGEGFNSTAIGSDSPLGSVIPEDAPAQPSPFVNEVAGDSASSVLITQATATPKRRRTQTPAPSTTATSTPTVTPVVPSLSFSPETNDTPSHLNGTQQQGQHVQYAIRAGATPSQGVNLGGWLVSEHWMNAASDIWKGLTDEQANSGEQTAFRNTPRDDAVARFASHRDSFITESDIAEIATLGLNTVRVPVGYWIVGFDDHDISGQKQYENYAPGGLAYLDKLIRDWAKTHNVAVLISMHGAKGSQNGADHSSPEQPSKSFWSDYTENLESTLDAVVFLADRYKNEDAFLGIGLMNEPGGSTSNTQLYAYYERAYRAIREDAGNGCVLTIAPLLWEQSAEFMTGVLPDATNVWVEWHRYFVWGYETSSEDELLGTAMAKFRDDVTAWKQKSSKKMFIGEFSFATAGKFQDETRLKQFGAKQLDVLTSVVDGGWTFWSWRIYGDDSDVNPWSLRSLVRNGLFSLPSSKQQSS